MSARVCHPFMRDKARGGDGTFGRGGLGGEIETMKRIYTLSDETRERAHKLLDSNTEMLHEYSEGGRCVHCNGRRVMLEFDAECPALLRCALHIASARNNVVEPSRGCGVCGSRLTRIRGRFPREPEREVCPTCCAERLDQINHISSRDYGVAAQSTVAPQSLTESLSHRVSDPSNAA